MSYATKTAVRPSRAAAAVASLIFGSGRSAEGQIAAGRSAMSLRSRASRSRPCRSHRCTCWAAGLAGSTQNGEPAAGLAAADVSRAAVVESASGADEQPAASPSTASAARVRVRVCRNILPPWAKVTVSDDVRLS